MAAVSSVCIMHASDLIYMHVWPLLLHYNHQIGGIIETLIRVRGGVGPCYKKKQDFKGWIDMFFLVLVGWHAILQLYAVAVCQPGNSTLTSIVACQR